MQQLDNKATVVCQANGPTATIPATDSVFCLNGTPYVPFNSASSTSTQGFALKRLFSVFLLLGIFFASTVAAADITIAANNEPTNVIVSLDL
jgi:hypothetical protein